jgi:hypothetical protein
MSQKISQFTQIVTLASGDYFPVVQTSGTTNKAVQVGALDQRYFVVASGNKAQSTADLAFSSGTAALASGNAALVSAATAQASGNAALVLGATAALKLPLSGGVVSGQFAQNIVPIGLYGSGINTALGNYFTATISGNSTVVISGAPSGVAYSFTYEVNHQTGTITWPTAVSWPAATAPTLTTGKTHIFLFVTDDQGGSWRASSLINYTT